MAPRLQVGTKWPRFTSTVILDGQRVGDNPVHWSTEKGFKDCPIVKEQIVNIKSVSEVSAGYASVFAKFKVKGWTNILAPTGKHINTPRCVWPVTSYPWLAYSPESKFTEAEILILPEMNEMVFDITTQHNLYTRSGTVTHKMLDDESRLVHNIVITNIIPKSQKNELSERMKAFFYAFKNNVENDLPNIIIEEMIDVSTKMVTQSSVPFAHLVMDILLNVGYTVFPNEPKDTKVKILDASNYHKSASIFLLHYHLSPFLQVST
ncbi:hypothetical protein GIB67_041670 [Kingdonia uniflora]|uniref:Uncharacterized protein n=1 Tax=Kingdonia uniflora TaxID=39325 RepID=A0A7J7MQK1_9MAGN|nr:hypothetical protein GIB67_041670 [Kingdonia uniflora]